MTQLSIAQELALAVDELDARGLVQASRWAAEQLCGLDEESQHQAAYCSSSSSSSSGTAWSQQEQQQQQHQQRHPRYLMARSHFQLKEYERAAHELQGVPGACPLFLRLYSLFLAGEKSKEQDRVEKAGPLGKSSDAANPHLSSLQELLSEARQGQYADDPFLMYLHGVVLMERKKVAAATPLLVHSLHAFPCNWSVWQALRPMCGSTAALQALDLPNHWIRDFFLASQLLELQQNQEALGRLQRLSHLFPHSSYMESLLAQAHYNLQNYDEAQSLFEDILTKDPYRLEGMDVFSNILFVKEQFAALSQLAHRVISTDKYSPEACCIVGNYYSLKGQHEKAVEYFHRALRLNPQYLAAWTLMGHEYMEMKNTPAAIDAYRRAVDLNPQDFRAWYGLGQAYELLKMPAYAVYYYRRATALRPHDARMWCALGQCYVSEQLGLQEQAIRCYRRAIQYNDPDGIAAHMLAKLYEARRDYAAAEQLHRYTLSRLEQAGQPLGADAVEALLFLAAVCKDTGRLGEAQAACERLLDVGGPAKERAKALAREIHSLQQEQLQQQQRRQLQQQQQQQQWGHAGHVEGQQLQQQQPPQHQTFRTLGRGAMAMQLSFQAAAEGYAAGRDDEGMDVMDEATEEEDTPTPHGSRTPSTTPGGQMRGTGGHRSARLAGMEGAPVAGRSGGPGGRPGVDDGTVADAAYSPLAVGAVMQQLRVSREHAVQLLDMAGGDPVQAITQHLHLLEPLT